MSSTDLRDALDSPPPPLWITDRAAVPADRRARAEQDGWQVEQGFDLPATPWDLAPRRWVRWGTVDTVEELRAAVLAAARGVGVLAGCASDPLRELLQDDLARVGPVEAVLLGPDPLDVLDADQRALLVALASGSSIADAAGELYLSTRTAERRLAAARSVLGVRTTAEAVSMAADS